MALRFEIIKINIFLCVYIFNLEVTQNCESRIRVEIDRIRPLRKNGSDTQEKFWMRILTSRKPAQIQNWEHPNPRANWCKYMMHTPWYRRQLCVGRRAGGTGFPGPLRLPQPQVQAHYSPTDKRQVLKSGRKDKLTNKHIDRDKYIYRQSNT